MTSCALHQLPRVSSGCGAFCAHSQQSLSVHAVYYHQAIDNCNSIYLLLQYIVVVYIRTRSRQKLLTSLSGVRRAQHARHQVYLPVPCCVSAFRFLSDGNSYKDCGHPCESKTLHLRDQGGADHLVLADMGCRNTVFNAKAQSGRLGNRKPWYVHCLHRTNTAHAPGHMGLGMYISAECQAPAVLAENLSRFSRRRQHVHLRKN